MKLNIKEQTELIERVRHEYTNYNSLLAVGARLRYPCKILQKDNPEKELIELHDVRCGRFGLPLKINNTVPMNCDHGICNHICLYLNATTFTPVIDTCSEYVIAKPKNSFLHEIGCPKGYYRTEYDYVESGNHQACYSIQMFQQPVAVEEVENENVIQSYCNGSVMIMNWGDDQFVFSQLADRIRLSDENKCLFSLKPNLIKYSEWHTSLTITFPFNFNWDKTMNYSRINEPSVTSYLVVKPNGQWTWATDTVSCIVCMVDSPIPTVELQLNYKILERRLELYVANQFYLYKEKPSDRGFICFSHFRGVYKANLTVYPMANGKYLIEDVGLGQYWCSGHKVISRKFLSSGDDDPMFAYGIWFSFEVVRKCSTSCSFNSADLTQFIEFFTRNNEHVVSIKGSTILEHKQPISNTEYTFTSLLSLILNYDPKVDSAKNLLNLTDYQLETYLIYEQLLQAIGRSDSQKMEITSIKSTEFCLFGKATSIESIIWGVALIGETIPTSPLCPSYGNGTKITRTCSGDSVNGSFWDEPVHVPTCQTFVSESLLELHENFNYSSRTTAVILKSLEHLLRENVQILLPLDVFLTSRILQNVSNSNVTFDELQNMLSIYSSLMKIDENFLKMSAYDDGFSFYSSGYIYPNQTIEDLVTDVERMTGKDLFVGSYLSTNILDALKNITVVIIVFFNDKLFQSTDEVPLEVEILKIYENVVSLKVLGLTDSSNRLRKIPMLFQINGTDDVSICDHWSMGSWSSRNCNSRRILATNFHPLTVCECFHFTYFRYLIIDGDCHEHMTIVTVSAALFSFIGALVVIVTAIGRKKWRNKLSFNILIHSRYKILTDQ